MTSLMYGTSLTTESFVSCFQYEDERDSVFLNTSGKELQNCKKKMATTTKRKLVRSTNAQINLLIDYMSANKLFALGEFTGPLGSQRADAEWESMRLLLSNYGPPKTVDQWKHTWRDLKKKAREEGARARVALGVTGNTQVVPKISESSKKILEIIGKESAEGLPVEGESGIGEFIVLPESDPWASPDALFDADQDSISHFETEYTSPGPSSRPPASLSRSPSPLFSLCHDRTSTWRSAPRLFPPAAAAAAPELARHSTPSPRPTSSPTLRVTSAPWRPARSLAPPAPVPAPRTPAPPGLTPRALGAPTPAPRALAAPTPAPRAPAPPSPAPRALAPPGPAPRALAAPTPAPPSPAPRALASPGPAPRALAAPTPAPRAPAPAVPAPRTPPAPGPAPPRQPPAGTSRLTPVGPRPQMQRRLGRRFEVASSPTERYIAGLTQQNIYLQEQVQEHRTTNALLFMMLKRRRQPIRSTPFSNLRF